MNHVPAIYHIMDSIVVGHLIIYRCRVLGLTYWSSHQIFLSFYIYCTHIYCIPLKLSNQVFEVRNSLGQTCICLLAVGHIHLLIFPISWITCHILISSFTYMYLRIKSIKICMHMFFPKTKEPCFFFICKLRKVKLIHENEKSLTNLHMTIMQSLSDFFIELIILKFLQF